MAKIATAKVLETATAKDFSGGWNTADSQVAINSKYAVVDDNIYYGIDNKKKVRQGTELFADLTEFMTADSTDGYFYYLYVITVAEDGSVYATDGEGNAARIWPKDNQPPWSATAAVSFVEMNGNLHIHNGVNKPIRVTPTLQTDYLTDIDGTNIQVPIGLVACKHGDWHCVMVGSTLHISHTRSPGTFEGDPAPNLGVSVELGSRVSRGLTNATAMISYRDVLMVMFAQCIIPLTIAVSDDGTELVVTFDDTIDNYGSFSHRTVQNLGEDVLFADIVGVNSIARTVFSRTLTPVYKSQPITKPMQKALNKLSTTTLRNKVFSVYDTNRKAYMLFVPDADVEEQVIQTACYINVKQDKPAKIDAWARFVDWKWNYAVRSAEGNIFYGNKRQIYLFGSAEINDINADYKGDQETFDDGYVFTDHTGFTPVADWDNSGIPIRFVWEFPWSYMKKRENQKTSKFLTIDTEGSGQFTAEMYVDYFYQDLSDLGEPFTDGTLFTDGTGFEHLNPPLDPHLSIEFIGKDALGYGGQLYGNSPYGGGRTTAEVRTYKWPAKFKLMKLRFRGEIMEPLEFVGVTLSYYVGSIKRGG